MGDETGSRDARMTDRVAECLIITHLARRQRQQQQSVDAQTPKHNSSSRS